MLNKLSLKYRIALVIFVLEAVMLTAVLSFTFVESNKAIRKQQNESQDVIVGFVSELAADSLLTEEYGDIQFYIEQLIKDPSIERILLSDVTNNVVASDLIAEIGKPAASHRLCQRLTRQTRHSIFQSSVTLSYRALQKSGNKYCCQWYVCYLSYRPDGRICLDSSSGKTEIFRR